MSSTTEPQLDGAGSPDDVGGRVRRFGRPRRGWRDRLVASWPVAVAAVALSVAHGYEAAYTDNQHTYVAHALAGAEGGALAADPLVRSLDPVPVFTTLVQPLLSLFDGPAALDLLWPVAAVAFFCALWSVTGRHAGRHLGRLLLWVTGMALLVAPWTQSAWNRVTDRVNGLPRPLTFLEGVANQYALGGYVQPSIAAVLAVVGAAVAIRRPGRLRGAALPLGTALVASAVVVHPSFAAGAALVVLSLVVAELWGRRSEPSRALASAARGIVPALVVGGIAAALNRNVLGALDHERPGVAREAARILAEERIPAHAQVGTWFSAATVAVLAAVVAAAVLALRSEGEPERRLGRLLAVGAALTAVTTVAVWLVDRPTWSLTFPWRASVVLVPLATSYLVARLAHRLVDIGEESLPVRFGLRLTAVVVILASMQSGYGATQRSDDHPRPYRELVATVEELDLRGVGVVPTELSELRMDAQVAVLADRENHPVEAGAVVRWWRDVRRVDAAMDDPDRFCELLEDVEPAWVVVELQLAFRLQDTCLANWTFDAGGDHAIAVAPA